MSFSRDGKQCMPALSCGASCLSTKVEWQHVYNSCCGYNPSATTAKDSFHGTGFSLLQHPTSANGHVCVWALSSWEVMPVHKLLAVCHISILMCHLTSTVKQSTFPTTSMISLKWDNYRKHAEGEYRWLENTRHVLEENAELENISWAAYHAEHQESCD